MTDVVSIYFYFLRCAVRNRLIARARRLKQPRYVISLIIGILYFVLVFGKSAFTRTWGERMPFAADAYAFAVTLGGVGAMVLLAIPWAWPTSGAGLEFTEAEIQFLFPAPLQRWKIIFYKVVRGLPGILFTTFMFMLVTRPLRNVAGVIATLLFLNLYFLMVRFARARLQLAGIGFGVRLVAVVVLMVIFFATIYFAVAPAMQAFEPMLRKKPAPVSALPLLTKAFDQPLLNAILFVPSLLPRAFFAPSFSEGLLPTVGLLLIAPIFFLIASAFDVSHEDASIEASKKKADQLTRFKDRKQGKVIALRRLPPPFKLGATGPAAVAILWKNLIGAGRISSGPLLAILLSSILPIIGLTFFAKMERSVLTLAGVFSFGFAGLILMLGPRIFMADLRSDYDKLELLKAYPLRGVEVVAASVSAPASVMAIVAAFYVITGLVLFSIAGGLNEVIGGLSAAALILILPFAFFQAMVPNAFLVLYPAWSSPAKQATHGVEALGHNILMFISQAIIILVALLPAAIVTAPLLWLLKIWLGWGEAIVISALPVAAILSAECWWAINFLGDRFEEIDVSTDLDQSTTEA